MKFSIAAIAGLFLIVSTQDTLAFAPSTIPAVSRPTSLPLFANADEESNTSNNKSMMEYLPKINSNSAASFLMASFLAVSTVATTTTAIPAFIESAQAAPVKTVETPKETPKKKTVEAPKKKTVETPKIVSSEEKDLKKAKSNLNASKETLNAYEKQSSDAKSADKKALSALETATNNASTAKKAYVEVSDKLSAAKKQKMPQSAVKELSATAANLKEVSKEKETIFNSASKTASKTAKEVEVAEKGIKESQKVIKKAEKNVKKAEKSFKGYTKAVKKQVKKQEQKVKALENQAKKMKAMKEKETKELSSKQKAVESEVKNLKNLNLKKL
mmetsp:Transcript_5810/g.6766  ORF Transcript_5810/g.6766 Transcript_5810/m.6766 type:complete len:330 (-) Transcript_5810:310-1299(-)